MSKICSPKLKKLAELFILIYLAECTLGNSGRWLEIGSLSIRMILFAVCFLLTLPFVFQNIKKLAINFQILATVFFGIYLVVCIGIGIHYGNNPAFIKSDVTTLASLALFPGFFSVMCNRDSIRRACNVIFWSATVLATVTIALHILLAFLSNESVSVLADILAKKSLGGIALLQTGIYRIYMRSQIFLQVAIVFGILKIKECANIKRFWIYLCEGVLFFACILSYTRGFWIGLAVSALIILILSAKDWKIYFKTIFCALSVFTVFCAISFLLYGGPMVLVEIVNRFDPDLIVLSGNNPTGDQDFILSPDEYLADIPELDITDSQNQNAAKIRVASLGKMSEMIKEHPIFGNGLGANLDGIRSDGRTEYMYHDIILKSGFLGFVLFMLVFFFCVFVHIKNEILYRRKKCISSESTALIQRNRIIIAAYLGVAVTSFFNPFLNNPMGIALMMLTATAVLEQEKAQGE